MLVFRSEVILAIGAHPDDIELGCGGTLCNAARLGKKVIAVFLTKGERSGNPQDRVNESTEALSLFNIKNVTFGDFPDTEIPNNRKAIEFLEEFNNKYEPEIVLTHSVNDFHQDHRQVGWLSLAALRTVPKILAYESPRVSSSFAPTYFVDISDSISTKWSALKCHLSQCQKRYLTYESMINLASFRGSQVSISAAEAFEVVRYVEKVP
jgi:LmbE family N-acetylglucosaminyl deacetylase